MVNKKLKGNDDKTKTLYALQEEINLCSSICLSHQAGETNIIFK